MRSPWSGRSRDAASSRSRASDELPHQRGTAPTHQARSSRWSWGLLLYWVLTGLMGEPGSATPRSGLLDLRRRLHPARRDGRHLGATRVGTTRAATSTVDRLRLPGLGLRTPPAPDLLQRTLPPPREQQPSGPRGGAHVDPSPRPRGESPDWEASRPTPTRVVVGRCSRVAGTHGSLHALRAIHPPGQTATRPRLAGPAGSIRSSVTGQAPAGHGRRAAARRSAQ